MQLGMIGLGRMGGNIVRRLMKHGHTTVVYDKDAKAVAGLAADGAAGTGTLEDFVKKLEKPRTAWVMLPAGSITQAARGFSSLATNSSSAPEPRAPSAAIAATALGSLS
jgi:6-phosphogluconate dehydrogenase (decarboxylating)